MATDFKYKLSVEFKTAQAGDTVFIKSGETLVIDSLCGTEEKPVVITSYCDKPAIIQSGDKGGLHIYNSKHLKIERIHLIGSGRKNGNTENGLLLNNCSHVTLSEIETEGYQKSGLCIYDSSDIIAEGIFAHDNGFSGIFVAGEYGRKDATRNIGIKDSKAENNPGDPAVPDNHSGNGILVGFSSNVTIEYCTATGNGWDMPRKGNGPVGIWAYESDSILIQYCIAYRNKTSEGAADGGGFDLDGGVTNSVIQYCLSYENEGSGFGLFQYAGASPWYNNTVRYCISENDGSISAAQAGVFVWNSSDDPQQLKDCYFYNNIIYNEKGSVISYEKQSLNSGFKFHNNIFVAKDELITGKDSTGIFLENSWYSFSSNYNSMKGKNRLSVEPKYIKAGKMNITDPRRLSSFFQKNAIEMK
ncbi:MAG: right-handed parallel beta-helix repeat-containing protein [Tannerella sp.]|nr:right-handed parallel beta-helix repeat-containing protein [Tannerella sp.]